MNLSEKICYDSILNCSYEELLNSKGFIIQVAMDNYNYDIIDKYYERLYFLMDSLERYEVVINNFNVAFCPKCSGSIWQIEIESHFCFRCGLKLVWPKKGFVSDKIEV